MYEVNYIFKFNLLNIYIIIVKKGLKIKSKIVYK